MVHSMYKILIIILLSYPLSIQVARAQSVTMKKDTVLINHKPVVRMERQSFDHYIFETMEGHRLLEAHNSKTEQKGKQVWVITFLNDKKKASFLRVGKSALGIAQSVCGAGLLRNSEVDVVAESKYISAHPLPEGYTDIDDLIEY